MFWVSLGVFIGQNEQILLLSHLAKTYRFGDLKIEFQSSVPAGSDYYFHTECPSLPPYVRTSQNFKIKRQSLPAGTVGWPSGSLMTPVLYLIGSNPKPMRLKR